MKNVKKFLAILLVACMALSLVACGGPAANNSQPAEPTPSTDPAPSQSQVVEETGIYTPGTYTAVAQGFGGPVTVELTVDAKAITGVKITGKGETPEYGGMAMRNLPDVITGAQSAEFDTVSSATYTTNAVRLAVGSALDQAKGNKPGTVADGKYTVEVVGHEGLVTVTTMFIGGKIASVSVPANNETIGVGTYAVKYMPSRIVEGQSVNVDSVGGASVSSVTIKQGVAEAIVLAGGNVADFIGETEKVVVEEEINETVDVVIMGAGTAGIMAAARLMEAGVENVILFEKSEIPGGCFATAYGGFNNTDSQTIANWGTGKYAYCNTWEVTGPILLKGINARAASTKAYDQRDLPAVERTFEDLVWLKQNYQTGGKLYDWMVSIGVGFSSLGAIPGATSPAFAPGIYAGGCGYAMQFFVDRITRQGARIIYNTPVVDLIQAEDGTVTGVIAKGEDGKTWTVNAEAVMLASGSFAKNKDLLQQYHPEVVDKYFNAPETLTGDGLILGLEAGGVVDYAGAYLPGFLASYDSHFELAFMHYTTAGIIVNVNGDQFGNIMKDNHGMMSAAKADPANGDTFYYVFDNDQAASTRDNEYYAFTTYNAIFEKGEAVHYESLEAAAEALNLPNLVKTVEDNNALALAGEANEWGRSGLPYIDTREGVWLIRVDPNYYLTTAGLRVDIDGHVLTAEDEIIPGLWAAGDVIGAYEERDGQKYGNGFNVAFIFGSIVGDNMAEVVK